MTSYVAQAVVAGVVTNLLGFDDPITISSGNIVSGSITVVPPADTTYYDQPGAQVGWTLSGGVLSAPTDGFSQLPTTAADLQNYALGHSRAFIRAGFTATIAGVPHKFATDIASTAMVNGAIIRLGLASPPTQITWPFLTGSATLSAANFLIAGTALLDWLLNVETVLANVNAGIGTTYTTFSSLNTIAWPRAAYP